MTDQVQEMLIQLVKAQMEKKSSKKNTAKPSIEKHSLSEDEIEIEKFKAHHTKANMEFYGKVSEEEKWKIYRRLILENITKFLMVLLYCVVGLIALLKFGVMLLTLFQNFLHDLFITAAK